jgi:polysaccharide chain length determinant protein (PEP-CTERM system associated)
MPYETPTPAPDEPFVFRAIEILRRRAVLAFVVFTAILISAVAFARYLPDLFQANAVVLVERQLPETVVRPVASGELESRLHIIRQEILSRARLTDLINRFDLYPDLRAKGEMDTALEQVRRDIQIELTGPEQVNGRSKTVAFNLTFIGSTRDTVANVTNSIAAFYVAQNDQMRFQDAARATQFLKTQLDSARQQLEQNEKQVEAYTSRHVGELPQQVGVNLATLERLNTQLRLNGEQQLRILDQRDRLFDTPAAQTSPGPVAASSPEDARLEKLRRDLAQLEGFPSKHPDVKRIEDEIGRLENEVKSRPPEPTAAAPIARRTDAPQPMRARKVEGLDAEIASLKAGEAAIRQSIATLEQRLEDVPYRENEFALLTRNHQAARDQYDSLLKRYEEAQLSESMETENQGERFRILEAAIPPTGPNAPNRVRLLLLGFFLAVVAAGVTVLAVEQFDTSFHSVDDVRHFTNVPVLVAIPRIGVSPASNWVRATAVTASMLVGFIAVGTLSAYVADGNEPLVRLLARGV